MDKTFMKLVGKEAELIAEKKKVNNKDSEQRSRPALNPENREKQLVSLAVDLAEKQLREGTASSQVISHYLKIGSTRDQLEREKLEAENTLLKAKAENLQSQKKVEELYAEALGAMRTYAGQVGGESDEY